MVKGGRTCINNLASDDGMRHHCPDDLAHLLHCLHHPLGDVALPCCCWLAMCVMGVVEVLVMPYIFLLNSGHSCRFQWILEE